MHGQATTYPRLVFLRMGFYIQFYHFGYMFRKYWEVYIQKISPVIICAVCITVNVILICIYGGKINFPSTAWMGSFNTWYLPLLTSITGTLFWYEVASILAKYFGERKAITFLSKSTFTIMMTHLVFLRIPQFFALWTKVKGIHHFQDFDMSSFIRNPWYNNGNGFRLVGFFCGLFGSLLISWIVEKGKN